MPTLFSIFGGGEESYMENSDPGGEESRWWGEESWKEVTWKAQTLEKSRTGSEERNDGEGSHMEIPDPGEEEDKMLKGGIMGRKTMFKKTPEI